MKGNNTMVEIITTERKDFEHYSKVRAVARDENKDWLSFASVTFSRSSFGSEMIKTMYTGGVNTFVEHRRGGNVRKIFEYMKVQDEREPEYVSEN